MTGFPYPTPDPERAVELRSKLAQERVARWTMITCLVLLMILLLGTLVILVLQNRHSGEVVEDCLIPGGTCYRQVSDNQQDAVRRAVEDALRDYTGRRPVVPVQPTTFPFP